MVKKEVIKNGEELTLDVVTTLHIHGRTFKFVYFNSSSKYCSIEDKYITDGRLNTPLYAPALHPSTSLTGCIEQTRIDCECDELINQGIPPMIAVAMVATGLDSKTVKEKLKVATEEIAAPAQTKKPTGRHM